MAKLSRGAMAHYQPARVACGGRFGLLTDALGAEVLRRVEERCGEWELEIGFGKGRYLLRRGAEEQAPPLMGIELVAQYFRLAADRAHRRGLDDLVLVQGEALFLLATWLPPAFARRIHVYFPDPWPKARHHRRRLFDEETVDLLLRALAPGGEILFASDHPQYGARVREVLQAHPGLDVEAVEGEWPGGARTNYEAKYIEEGRPILRLRVRPAAGAGDDLFHPLGRHGVLVGPRPEGDGDAGTEPGS